MGKRKALNCKLVEIGKTPFHFRILCSFEIQNVRSKLMSGGALACGDA